MHASTSSSLCALVQMFAASPSRAGCSAGVMLYLSVRAFAVEQCSRTAKVVNARVDRIGAAPSGRAGSLVFRVTRT